MFEKLISTLMASRDQAHIFHWQATGPGSYAAHKALGKYYDALPDMIDAVVEAYQGKHGILKGYEPAERFDEYSKDVAIKYFKALVLFVNRHLRCNALQWFLNRIVFKLWGKFHP